MIECKTYGAEFDKEFNRLKKLVSRDDETAYLMIECKTYGAEFDKEFNRLKKDGGQLFTSRIEFRSNCQR